MADAVRRATSRRGRRHRGRDERRWAQRRTAGVGDRLREPAAAAAGPVAEDGRAHPGQASERGRPRSRTERSQRCMLRDGGRPRGPSGTRAGPAGRAPDQPADHGDRARTAVGAMEGQHREAVPRGRPPPGLRLPTRPRPKGVHPAPGRATSRRRGGAVHPLPVDRSGGGERRRGHAGRPGDGWISRSFRARRRGGSPQVLPHPRHAGGQARRRRRSRQRAVRAPARRGRPPRGQRSLAASDRLRGGQRRSGDLAERRARSRRRRGAVRRAADARRDVVPRRRRGAGPAVTRCPAPGVGSRGPLQPAARRRRRPEGAGADLHGVPPGPHGVRAARRTRRAARGRAVGDDATPAHRRPRRRGTVGAGRGSRRSGAPR